MSRGWGNDEERKARLEEDRMARLMQGAPLSRLNSDPNIKADKTGDRINKIQDPETQKKVQEAEAYLKERDRIEQQQQKQQQQPPPQQVPLAQQQQPQKVVTSAGSAQVLAGPGLFRGQGQPVPPQQQPHVVAVQQPLPPIQQVRISNPSSNPSSGGGRKLCTFELSPAGSNAPSKIELETTQTLTDLCIRVRPTRWYEEITIIIQNREIKFETKHQEQYREREKEIVEHVTFSKVVELPFDIDLNKLCLKPTPGPEGLELQIQKPSF